MEKIITIATLGRVDRNYAPKVIKVHACSTKGEWMILNIHHENSKVSEQCIRKGTMLRIREVEDIDYPIYNPGAQVKVYWVQDEILTENFIL